MTEESRREWLMVAWETLKHLPPDILASGCRVARETCDHPSKIVPAIIQATKESIVSRRNIASWDADVRALPAPEPDYCTPEEARAILKQYGLKSDFAASEAKG